jgi:hypothetical protein
MDLVWICPVNMWLSRNVSLLLCMDWVGIWLISVHGPIGIAICVWMEKVVICSIIMHVVGWKYNNRANKLPLMRHIGLLGKLRLLSCCSLEKMTCFVRRSRGKVAVFMDNLGFVQFGSTLQYFSISIEILDRKCSCPLYTPLLPTQVFLDNASLYRH